MILSENDYQILKLTDAFYKAYPNPPYREILKKKQRAYNCFRLIIIILYIFHIEQKSVIDMHFILPIH